MKTQPIGIELLEPDPNQPRKYFGSEGLNQLAESIRDQGLLQPILVRTISDEPRRYRIVAGERRWRACGIAGIHTIDSIVRDDLDEDELRIAALAENMARESLSCVEIGKGLQQLVDKGLSVRKIGEQLGVSHTQVVRLTSVSSMDSEAALAVSKSGLGLGHVCLLVGLPLHAQLRWIEKITQNEISVRKLKGMLANEDTKQTPKKEINPDNARLENAISEQLGCVTSLSYDKKTGKGFLKLNYSNLEELDGILNRMDVEIG